MVERRWEAIAYKVVLAAVVGPVAVVVGVTAIEWLEAVAVAGMWADSANPSSICQVLIKK